MPLRPCLRCGRLVKGRSYCDEHRPARPSPSSTLGRVPGLRRKARRRDGERCARCGRAATRGNPLEVHHVRPVAELGRAANALENLLTVCRECHRAAHRRRPGARPD